MAAFEKVRSGIDRMDTALDYIRMGDNVVWQVSSLDEFRVFAGVFAAQAVRDGRNLIYIRFAGHEPILSPMDGLKIVNMELSHHFETFTIDIHNLIADEGKDAFYVFDCLSELEEAWATDLLMGDFFHLTCPFLFDLDTVAFFPVIRGLHSFDAIAKIRDTTQLFLDVYPADGEELFVRPLKVWNRYSQTMFNPHKYDARTGEFSDKIMNGRFSSKMEAEFRRLLEYYGSAPIIVRSSSILEDGFGNAFAGKYDSVFCGGNGTQEERLAAFEQAIRVVYASTVSISALDYRKRRGLEKNDEQMALLVQRVSGSRYDRFFMPCAAGVGYSISPYRLGAGRPEEGMMRLVAGLGTAAVDRRTGSYPRIVSLDNPSKVMLTSFSDRHRFSQRLIDAVSGATGREESFDAEEIRVALPDYLVKKLFSHDRDAERMMEERGQRRQIFFVSCEEIVADGAIMEDMRAILRMLQAAYGNPVDIEYTINISPRSEYVIDILQCRPLQMPGGGQSVTVPPREAFERVLIETKGVSMGFSRSFPIDVLVYIDAVAYYEMPYNEKYEVRSALSAVNWKLRGKNKRLVLVAPGRICTSSPELGVPSAFSDISEFDAIIEVSESSVGFMPELSYGSHVFQDLVEAGILYSAVFEDDTTLSFAPDDLRAVRKSLPDYVGGEGKLQSVVYVYDVAPGALMMYYDMSSEHLLIAKARQ